MEKKSIHPHIKNFVSAVVMSEAGGQLKWKETLIKEFQQLVFSNKISSKEELAQIVEETKQELLKESQKFIEFASEVMTQVPMHLVAKNK